MEVPEESGVPGGLRFSGLVQEKSGFLIRVLDAEKMKQAELVAARIISGIQPNQTSEQRRKSIITYVRGVITKKFSCQVISFGSVPLKTYLPDGDIDITVRSDNQTLSDILINGVLNVLENEEKSENANLRVKGVRYIQAEVKIIKCLIENIVVDISFNQIGGLRTLFFLEKVDNLINGNHLFKHSVLLIKAWCYYESRILGAHHGLISTYALEILILYIFLVFDKKFSGPLEVLYRFLEFFSKFDWGNFCISLWGPVPISSIPNMAAEPPRKDCLELPLTKLFHDVCGSVNDSFPGGQENQEHHFATKYFNVIDPLRANNNLGRSISEGNFYRIRSAFALGAEQLATLLDCPREDLLINSFFRKTSGGHEKGHHPGSPGPSHFRQQSLRFNQSSMSEGFRKFRGGEKDKGDPTDHESTIQLNHAAYASNGVLPHNKNHGLKQTSRTGNFSKVSCDFGQKSRARFNRSMVSDQNKKKVDYLKHDEHARYHFGCTNMRDSSGEVPEFERKIDTSEARNSRIASGGSANESMHINADILENHMTRFLGEDSLSSSRRSAHNLMDDTINSKGTFNDNYTDCLEETMKDERHPLAERFQVHQIDKDPVHALPSSSHHVHTLPSSGSQLDGKNQMSMHSTYGHSLCPIQSLDYAKMIVASMHPTDESSESSRSLNRQRSRGYLPLQVPKIFPLKMAPKNAEMSKLFSGQKDGDHGNLSFQVNPVRCLDHNEGRCHSQVQGNIRQQKNSSQVCCSGNFLPRDLKIIAENQYPARRTNDQSVQGQRTREFCVQTSSCLRPIPSSQADNLRSKPSSSRYWNRLPKMSNKFQKYKWQKKSEISKDNSVPRGMDENELQCEDKSIFSPVSSNDQKTAPCSTIGNEPTENTVSDGMAALNIQMHASSCCEPAPVTSSTSMIPVVQMFVDPQSDNRVNRKHEALQLKSHIRSPSVQLLRRLPVSNRPNDKGNETSFRENFDRGKQVIKSQDSLLCQDLNSTEAIHQQEHDGHPFHLDSHVQVRPMDLKENIPCNIGSSAANMNLFYQSETNPPYPKVSSVDQKCYKCGNNRASCSYGRRDYYIGCQGNWNKNSKLGIGDRSHSQTHQPNMKMNGMNESK